MGEEDIKACCRFQYPSVIARDDDRNHGIGIQNLGETSD